MKLFEYQAKAIFGDQQIALPKGHLAESCEQVASAAEEFGNKCVLKSQVLTGGRGKAGLIQFADSDQQVKDKSKELFSKQGVDRLLVEELLDIDTELYLSVTYDSKKAKAVIMASTSGGVDIEQVAVQSPEKIVTEYVDTSIGLMGFQVRSILFALGLKGEVFKQTYKIIDSLYEVFVAKDAELAEINPLIVTKDLKVVAADGKLIIDDNASFRQKSFELTRQYFDTDVEFEASQKGIPYIQFNGDIGLMCAGAGLTNTVYDLINYYDGSVANYLEFGGPNYKRAVEAMELTLKSNPKVILIVTFGTIARADVMAEGITKAIEKLKPEVPIVTAIRGTGEQEAGQILESIGLEPLSETEDAVRRAVELCGGKK